MVLRSAAPRSASRGTSSRCAATGGSRSGCPRGDARDGRHARRGRPWPSAASHAHRLARSRKCPTSQCAGVRMPARAVVAPLRRCAPGVARGSGRRRPLGPGAAGSARAGPDARAAIEIEGVGDSPPSLTVNVGRVERLRSAGAGRFVADYVPPAERHLQVAIVAASAAAPELDEHPARGSRVRDRALRPARAHPRHHRRCGVRTGDGGRVRRGTRPGRRAARRASPTSATSRSISTSPRCCTSTSRSGASMRWPTRAHDVRCAPSSSRRPARAAGAPLRVEVSEGRVGPRGDRAGSWAGTAARARSCRRREGIRRARGRAPAHGGRAGPAGGRFACAALGAEPTRGSPRTARFCCGSSRPTREGIPSRRRRRWR